MRRTIEVTLSDGRAFVFADAEVGVITEDQTMTSDRYQRIVTMGYEIHWFGPIPDGWPGSSAEFELAPRVGRITFAPVSAKVIVLKDAAGRLGP